MPEPTTVWMVRLRRGEMAERKGLLTLDVDGLVFHDGSLSRTHTFPFEQVRRARRVKGSPILIVTHEDERGRVETAFYFTEPPPLQPADPFSVAETEVRTLSPFAAMRRTSKRRHMRQNVGYLAARSAPTKAEIQAWVDEIRARLGQGA